MHWPCPALDHPGTPYLFEEDFPRGRGKFWPVEYGTQSELPDEDYPFILSTGPRAVPLARRHDDPRLGAGRDLARNAPWRCTPTTRPSWAWRPATGWTCRSRRGEITARLLVTGRSPAGHDLHPLPLRRSRRQRPDRQPAGPAGQDPRLQGLRGARRAAAAPPDRPGADISPFIDRGTIKDPVRRLISIWRKPS